jgi:hypothetical protein
MQQASSSFCAQTIVHAVVITRAFLAVLLWSCIGAVCADSLTATSHGTSKESFEFAGLKRSYTLFAPARQPRRLRRLLVLLHGSYGSGAAMVSWWSSLAEQEGIVLVGPKAREREAWQLRADGPQFIRALIDTVAAKHPDRSRAHLSVRNFGRCSLCADAVDVGVATVRGHGDTRRRVARTERIRAVPYAKRKIPIAISSATRTSTFRCSRCARRRARSSRPVIR